MDSVKIDVVEKYDTIIISSSHCLRFIVAIDIARVRLTRFLLNGKILASDAIRCGAISMQWIPRELVVVHVRMQYVA